MRLNEAVLVFRSAPIPSGGLRVHAHRRISRGRSKPVAEALDLRRVRDFTVLETNDVVDEREV